jgi:NADH-quinone oxidoreductase subunit E
MDSTEVDRREADSATATRREPVISAETVEKAREIIGRYPAGRERSALLPLLHLVQAEQGQVTPAGVEFCAEQLGISKAQVGAVATFYTMYKRRPTGEFLVSVCTNTLCDVLGGGDIFRQLSEDLGVGHDETVADGSITLEHAECLAACDYAPVVTVNYEFYDNQTTESASALVAGLRAGERPAPTRGAGLCTLREMALQNAGLTDDRAGAVEAAAASAPTMRGTRLAEDNDITAPRYDVNAPIPAAPAKEGPK